MQTVRDANGDTYLLVKRSGESSRVRDPETGQERYVENASLEAVDGQSPLTTASLAVPDAVRRVIRSVHDDRTIGLLVELVDAGSLSVNRLMDDYDMCESDLHGRLVEFRVAGLIEEVEIAGRRGYEATDDADRAIRLLRGAEPEPGPVETADE